MAKKSDDVRSFDQIKAYPRGSAQGGRAIQAVKGFMSEDDGADGHRTVVRETAEGRAIARTRHYQPMVEVEKQGCEIGVDHGVIDMLSVAQLNPDAYKNGKLYATEYVKSHVLGAVPTDPIRPIIDEIEPPDSVKGVAPADGADAKSLRANDKGDNRDALYAKKVMMGRCPASIFTGRTRLWVQAMYGRHDALGLLQLAGTLPSATPAISITQANPSLWITTNSGIYYDAATANHYLINVFHDHVDIYPMAAEDCIEELRPFLLDPTLPEADKERIETYILADSLPVQSKKQTVAIAATSSYSMGYGWHFNWDGDRCDIVLNDIVAASGGGQENISAHYRLTFSKSVKGIWSVERSIVEGPTRWKSLRHVEPITEPLWEEGRSLKFGAHLGPLPHGDAPFYAFYAKNELKVCRYKAISTDHTPEGITRTPAYFNYYNPYSIGSDEVKYHGRGSWSGSTTTVSCGTEVVTFERGAHVDFVYTRTAPALDMSDAYHFGPTSGYSTGLQSFPSGQPGSMTLGTDVDPYFGTITVYGGVAGTGNLSGWGLSTVYFDNQRGDNGNASGVSSVERFTASVQKYTQFIVSIPFYDAEALYLYGEQQVETHETGTAGVLRDRFYGFNGVWETQDLVFYGQAAGGGTDLNTYVETGAIDRSTTSTSSYSKLVCSVGTFNADIPGKSGFWAAEDSVSQQLPTYSSASAKAVKGPNTAVDSGNSPSTDSSLYVGWA